MWTVDISDKGNPAVSGHTQTPGNVNAVDLRGDYAFTCAYTDGLVLTDVSDPSQPVYVGSYPGDYLNSVFVSDYFAFVTDRDYGLIIVDITSPSNPVFTSDLEFPGNTENVFVQGDYVYIANRGNGLNIVDITDISNPVVVGNCDTPGYAVSVYVEGDFAYIADGYHGVQIIDISNLLNPRLRFTIDTEDYAKDIVVTGDYAIVAEDSTGLEVIDISEAGTPAIVTSYDTPGEAVDLKVVGDYIYVADYYSLMILHLDRETGTLEQTNIPSGFSLSQNYPNPFNATTTIRYDVPVSSRVVIEIYDILGRKIETLVDGLRSSGSYTAVWDAGDASSGLYFYRLRTDDYSDYRRMLLIK